MMHPHSSKTILAAVAIATCCTSALPAQIHQNRPDLCGNVARAVLLPPNITATSSDAHSTLWVKGVNGVEATEMSGVNYVVQVCPDIASQLFVFGAMDRDHYYFHIYALDQRSAKLTGILETMTPAMSPDQRWIVYRDEYPAHFSEIPLSEEYLLYNTQKSPSENVVPGIDPSWKDVKGRVAYPRVPGDRPYPNYLLKKEDVHEFSSRALFWSPDSRSFLFADTRNDVLSAVWVEINKDGGFTTSIRRIAADELCEELPENQDKPQFLLTNVDFGAAGDGEATLEFRVHGCKAHPPLRVSRAEFSAAPLEPTSDPDAPPKKESTLVEQ